MAGASAENPPQSERPSTNEPPFQQTPEPKSALPALVPLPSGTSFLQAQRLDAPASTVSESTTRLIDSVFSTDIFEYTDLPLLTWFRKHTLVADGEVPFFSTPTLAKLMLKENQDLKSYVSAFQSKISSLTGIHRMSALVALTETIFTAYQPSSPTIIKLSIHFLTNTAGLSDDAFNGLDPTASILSLITDFITNYYQVQNHQLAQFERDEIIAGQLISRHSLDGSFSTQPGYLRLCADRTVFTDAAEITEYFDTWSTLWRMLKTCLCAGVQFVPDVDLAIRRRIINGLKTHPLRQQFTVSGPEPARLWLGRYHKADEAGLVFEKQAGFNCGLTLDDVGHISIGMDAIHECLLDLFSLVLMQANIGTVNVPRVLPELKIFEPNRRLPDCTWPQFITVFTKTEQLYDNSLNKKTWPLTRPLAITSNLTSTESPGSGGDRAKDKKCKYCRGPHYTSDCPSPERASAEVCRQHLAGKCRNGAKHCKYLHPNKSETQLAGNNKDSADHKSKNSSQNSQKKDSQGNSNVPDQSLVADRQKPPPDDFTKAQTRTCSIPECAKSFTIPLEGDKGTKWYQDKGLFLPKRCQECIQSGRTNWKSKPPTESQLSQAGHLADDPTADPDAVESFFADVSDVSDSESAHPGSTTTVSPSDRSEPQDDQPPTASESQAARSEPSNSSELSQVDSHVAHQYLFPSPSLSSRRLPIAAYSLMADRLSTSSRMQQITGHRRRTISVNDIHDCLLELWGGLPVAPEAFDAARRAIHEYMVTGHWTPSGEILMWGGEAVAITAAEPAAVFASLCRQCASTGLNDSCVELCHGFVEAISRLSLDGAMTHMSIGDTDSESNVSSLESSDTSSDCSDNAEWLQRVSNKYGGGYLEGPLPAPSLPENDSGRQLPTRARASPVRFQPSPSGMAQDCVSPGEYFAAVVDPNLSDASVMSAAETETESTSGSESGLNLSFGAALASIVCLAILCLGHVVGDEQLIHFLPSTQVEPNEEPHSAADRLAASLYLGDHLVVPVNNTALEDGTVIRTYALNLGTREYDMIPTAQQISELLDSRTVRWVSQDHVNTGIGPLTDALNEAFSEATHQNLINGVGHLSIVSDSTSLFREAQAQTLLSMCANEANDESDSSLPELISVDEVSSESSDDPYAIFDTTVSEGVEYNLEGVSDVSHAYSYLIVVDTDDPSSHFPEHGQIPPYLEPGDLGYSSADDYSWSDPEGEFTDDSESSSIPIHTRYDIDSDIDESRFSDTPSDSSLLEEWNYEFWPAQQTTPTPQADSYAIPSADGQGETLEQLNAPCPWTAADDARDALAAALQSPTNSTAHVDYTVVYNEATNSIELPDQQNEPAVETPTNTTQSGPTNSTAYVDDTVVHDETTSNIALHHPVRALVDFRLINMAVAPPCAPWSSLSERRHYESILLSYRQTNCAHRLGVVMACVYNKWLTRWAPCKLRFLHAMMRHVSNFIMRWTAINILRLWNVCAISHRQEVNHESGLALTHGSIYRQRYWSINSLHRVLQSDAAPTLRDICVWFVRRWALRADVYFDRYLALHANDCTVSTADGDAIMTILCNWLFHNSMRFYQSHPASMGWLVGRQVASSSNHYQHFLNSILRQLTTTAATCIRTVFHCRPAHSSHATGTTTEIIGRCRQTSSRLST